MNKGVVSDRLRIKTWQNLVICVHREGKKEKKFASGLFKFVLRVGKILLPAGNSSQQGCFHTLSI